MTSAMVTYITIIHFVMTSASENHYHTITIDGNLEKIKPDYDEEVIKDSLSKDYWLKQLDDSNNKERYKVQYTSSNGPRSYPA